jgi:hypothetical protein
MRAGLAAGFSVLNSVLLVTCQCVTVSVLVRRVRVRTLAVPTIVHIHMVEHVTRVCHSQHPPPTRSALFKLLAVL